MNITIFAATGGTGRHLLRLAVAAGHDVTAVVRDPRKLPATPARVVTADLVTAPPSALEPAVTGADAVLSGLGPRGNADAGVASGGTKTIIKAMRETGSRRLVVISSESMTTIPSPGRPDPPKHDPGEGFMLRYVVGPPARWLLRKQYADLGIMEDLVRDSGLAWTIARPALLTNRPATGAWRVGHERKPRGGFRISRADLAHFMLQLIDRPDTIGKSLTITH